MYTLLFGSLLIGCDSSQLDPEDQRNRPENKKKASIQDEVSDEKQAEKNPEKKEAIKPEKKSQQNTNPET